MKASLTDFCRSSRFTGLTPTMASGVSNTNARLCFFEGDPSLPNARPVNALLGHYPFKAALRACNKTSTPAA